MKNFLDKIFLYVYRRGEKLSRTYNETKLRKKYNLPSTFKFNGTNILIYGNGKLVMGNNTYVGSFSTIQIQENFTVKIGDNCKISHNVRIYTTTNFPDQDFNEEKISFYSKDVIIGNGVWIGANVFINPGVTIGNNSVIGANAVITRDVLENTIVAGVPAKIIRHKLIE